MTLIQCSYVNTVASDYWSRFMQFSWRFRFGCRVHLHLGLLIHQYDTVVQIMSKRSKCLFNNSNILWVQNWVQERVKGQGIRLKLLAYLVVVALPANLVFAYWNTGNTHQQQQLLLLVKQCFIQLWITLPCRQLSTRPTRPSRPTNNKQQRTTSMIE